MPSGLFYLKSLYQSISCNRGVWLVFIITTFYRNLCWMQTVKNLIILRRLIWVNTVCQCPFYGTIGTNGLILSFERCHFKRDTKTILIVASSESMATLLKTMTELSFQLGRVKRKVPSRYPITLALNRVCIFTVSPGLFLYIIWALRTFEHAQNAKIQPSCACAKAHQCLCDLFIHSVVSNDSVSGQ